MNEPQFTVTSTQAQRWYQAMLDRDMEFEGVFYVGVRTTGVFCRPTCPARKPNFGNCEFFLNARAALHASYRPCKRCRPLSHPNIAPELVSKLVALVEAEPERRWREQDFRDLGIDTSTARRQFRKRFGMTVLEYARARRMGLALQTIRNGGTVMDAQLDTGFESGSGFRDAFNRIIGGPPSERGQEVLSASWIDTPLGPMLAVADEEQLVLLEFADRRGLETELKQLRSRYAIIPGTTAPLESISLELDEYFAGQRRTFSTPLRMIGTEFQRSVWEELRRIPYGEAISYMELARRTGRPTAFRAVAQANGANQLAVVIPCHRVINASGRIGGYGGGVPRKEWLLRMEAEATSA